MAESIVRPEGPASPEARVPILRFSTADLPPEDRYEAWLDRDWPRARSIYRTTPTEPFDTAWESAQLGPIVFVHTRITGMRWERRLDDIRSSDFDPIVVSMMIKGVAQGEIDGRPFHESDGMFHLHDLKRPSVHVSTASLTYNLIIPRPVAQARFGPLADLTARVVGPPRARLLFGLAAEVHEALPHLDVAHADRLGSVLLDVLEVCLGDRAGGAASPQASAERALRLKAEDFIERNMGAGDIPIAQLCRALDVPRARLFAVFKADGGVSSYVMSQRVIKARAALAERDPIEPIGSIAHRLGFSDASHLSRVFRERYGMTPSQYRRLSHDEAFEVPADER